MEQDKIYQRIGEFVVCFQFLENQFREIGWFILDPARREWPPPCLREESSYQLAEKVYDLYTNCLPCCKLPNEAQLRKSFRELVDQFHELRKQRNRFLHSAYIELKAAGEVKALLRSNPILKADPESNEPLMDQEILSESSFEKEMKEMAELSLNLGIHYKQLIHRLPVTEQP